jgi:hypothetical protein
VPRQLTPRRQAHALRAERAVAQDRVAKQPLDRQGLAADDPGLERADISLRLDLDLRRGAGAGQLECFWEALEREPVGEQRGHVDCPALQQSECVVNVYLSANDP